MSIIRIPFEPPHMDMIEPDPVFASMKASIRVDALMRGKGMSWIDTETASVLACGGYIIRREGVAWLWFMPSQRGSRMLLRMARFFKRWLNTLEPGIRLEAHVLADFQAGLRWVEFLGMERETGEPMRKWDGLNDYHQFARITGDEN